MVAGRFPYVSVPLISFDLKFVFSSSTQSLLCFFYVVVEPSERNTRIFGMRDEGTSTHVLVEHGKAENELEELQLTKSDKSKQRPSRTKAPNQEIKRREPAKRIHVEENQSLDVVKSFAESISANFTVLTESMTNSFQKLGENFKGDE